MTYYYSSSATAKSLVGSVTGTDTSIVLSDVAGLPASLPYKLVLDPGLSTEEIVRVDAAAGATLTVTRGWDGTSGQSHSNLAAVRHMVTAEDLRLSREHEDAASGVHGVVGALVGADQVQTLNNKTFGNATVFSTDVTVADTATAGELATDLVSIKGATAAGTAGPVVSVTASATAQDILRLTSFGLNGFALKVVNNLGEVPLTVTPIGQVVIDCTGTGGETALTVHAAVNPIGADNVAFFKDSAGVTAMAVTENGISTKHVQGTSAAFTGDLSAVKGIFSSSVSGTSGTFTGNVSVTGSVTANNLPRVASALSGAGLHWGTATATTDASGFATITHGADFTPTAVLVNFARDTGALYPNIVVGNVTATTFRIRVLANDGSAVASASNIPIFYICGG